MPIRARMVALVFGIAVLLSAGVFALPGEATVQARTDCNTQVFANTFIAYGIAVQDPVTCDGVVDPIRSFLEHGVISGWRCDEKYVIPHEVTCWPDAIGGGDVFFVYKPQTRTTRGVATAHAVEPLPGHYVGPGSPGHEVSFGFDGRHSVVHNFRVDHALYSDTYFRKVAVTRGEFRYDFRSGEFELIILGHWVAPGTVKGSIWQTGARAEHFKVSLDVPNP